MELSEKLLSRDECRANLHLFTLGEKVPVSSDNGSGGMDGIIKMFCHTIRNK